MGTKSPSWKSQLPQSLRHSWNSREHKPAEHTYAFKAEPTTRMCFQSAILLSLIKEHKSGETGLKVFTSLCCHYNTATCAEGGLYTAEAPRSSNINPAPRPRRHQGEVSILIRLLFQELQIMLPRRPWEDDAWWDSGGGMKCLALPWTWEQGKECVCGKNLSTCFGEISDLNLVLRYLFRL